MTKLQGFDAIADAMVVLNTVVLDVFDGRAVALLSADDDKKIMSASIEFISKVESIVYDILESEDDEL